MNLSRDKYTLHTVKAGFQCYVSCTFSFHLSLDTPYLIIFTGLLGYSTGIHKIYVKMENEYQKSQSVASSGKADEIFMIKIV